MEISVSQRNTGHPIYAGERLYIQATTHEAKRIAKELNAEYISKQVSRMNDAITNNDPELAIGTAKEFIESIAKTIVAESNENVPDDFQKLMRLALKQTGLVPDDIPEQAKASETIKVLLKNLQTVAVKINELRGPYGTGHGKHIRAKGLQLRHARLAVNSAIAFGVFLFDSFEERRKSKQPDTK